jgi:hypothetical protein
MGELYDSPNQQVVRGDGSHPSQEGAGGSAAAAGGDAKSVDEMTKAELLDYASSHGVQATPDMTKADILAAVKAAGG